jgi:hypothetical protein
MLKPDKLFGLLLLPWLFTLHVNAYAIEKCQDADGKWHYGDNAAAVCADSKITVLNKKGLKVKEIDRPPSHDEIEAREAEKKRKEVQAGIDNERKIARERILRIYPDEASIIKARDQRTAGIDKNISLNETMLDELRLKKKALDNAKKPKGEKAQKRQALQKERVQEYIDEYNVSISSLREDRERVQSKYGTILEEFYDLAGTGPVEAVAPQ